ncbi:MAG: MmcQ/YjbR family DNA-binding protein [Melioribacteraceae bacterium]|nr:MmcQ/YjbR family DNA-binding protein [Melioribacteraceae bacterium]
MDLEQIRDYCLKKKGVEETLPFDEITPVYKVLDKMFCLMNLTPPYSINLKCDPGKAVKLREEYEQVKPGYHMNKKHWNTVELEGNAKDSEILKWIDDSYTLVVKGMPKKNKQLLESL